MTHVKSHKGEPPPEPSKICLRCRRLYVNPEQHFDPDETRKDRLMRICRACLAALSNGTLESMIQ